MQLQDEKFWYPVWSSMYTNGDFNDQECREILRKEAWKRNVTLVDFKTFNSMDVFYDLFCNDLDKYY